METNVIHTGDCFDVLSDLSENSVHAVVTDPPYGLNFMPDVTNGWDDFEPKEYQEWCEEWATECLRVLKPGGHLLAFSGNRTHHRLFSGVEDAGFEIRDTVTWHFGSGFPKAADISKTIDKRADAEREVVGEKTAPDGVPMKDRVSHSGEEYDEDSADYGDCKRDVYERAPATDAAQKWDGWKTALKPATEYVVMARAPFEGATVDCVQEHGTGALNIEACRVGTDELEYTVTDQRGGHVNGDNSRQSAPVTAEGRYPANVIFDATTADALDAEVGESSDGGNAGNGYDWNGSHAMRDGMSGGASSYEDAGGPSRYFYTSKATRAERTLDGRIDNAHPTVKPADLMEWLVTLVTREGQLVLDPFAGSGTTCRAAKDKGRQFIGIEQQAKWADVARVRAGLTPHDPAHVRGDDGQSGLGEWE